MRKHVELAGVLYMLWGGMTVLLSFSLLSLGFAATAIGASEAHAATNGKLAAGLVAAGFFTLSAAGFLFGGVNAWIGSRLRAGKDWARAFAIVLAVVNLVLVPFGTALGIYTLWVLLHRASQILPEQRLARR